jgi:hypothetical protein
MATTYDPIIREIRESRDRHARKHGNDLVAKFVASGILHEFTGQTRNRRFIFRDDSI